MLTLGIVFAVLQHPAQWRKHLLFHSRLMGNDYMMRSQGGNRLIR